MALLRVADGETEIIAAGETRSAGPIDVEGTLNVAGTLNVGNISLTATANCGALTDAVASGAKLLSGSAEAGVSTSVRTSLTVTASAGAVAAAEPSEVVPLLRSSEFRVQGTGAVDD